jgi:hypothetical protein
MTTPEPVSSASTDTKAWAIKDSTWVEARKKAWKKIAANGLGNIERQASEVRALESYFLTGKTRLPVKWASRELPSVPLLFRVWFHPDRSEANWQAQLEATLWIDYDLSVSELWFLCGDNGPGIDGLESRMYDLLLGGPPTRSLLSHDPKGQLVRTDESIERYRVTVPIGALELALRVPGKYTRLVARYSIRHWLAMPDHPSWSEIVDSDDASQWLNRLFNHVRFRSAPEGVKSSTPDQIELATELRELFDQGIGPARFQHQWREHEKSDAWKLPPPRRY